MKISILHAGHPVSKRLVILDHPVLHGWHIGFENKLIFFRLL